MTFFSKGVLPGFSITIAHVDTELHVLTGVIEYIECMSNKSTVIGTVIEAEQQGVDFSPFINCKNATLLLFAIY